MTRDAVRGGTRVVGVIGDPVTHSRSPAMHNAAFEAAGLDWIYVAFPVAAGRGAAAVAAVRSLGLAGLNVTMPHKADAAGACSELTDDARQLGAVNTVVPRGEGLLGVSTDGEGFVAALGDEEIDPRGVPTLVIGAGGAARAIVLALGRAGAMVTVAARRYDAAAATAALAPGASATTLREADPGAALLVVNATPVGMRGEDPPLAVESLNHAAVVVDTIYHPMETPLIARSRARGLRAVNGIGMLVRQAAASFELWTKTQAPLDAMRAAALRVPA